MNRHYKIPALTAGMTKKPLVCGLVGFRDSVVGLFQFCDHWSGRFLGHFDLLIGLYQLFGRLFEPVEVRMTVQC